jgi:hypothetical protein
MAFDTNSFKNRLTENDIITDIPKLEDLERKSLDEVVEPEYEPEEEEDQKQEEKPEKIGEKEALFTRPKVPIWLINKLPLANRKVGENRKQPWLLLINPYKMEIEIIKKVKRGMFIIKEKDGTKKGIMLTAGKLMGMQQDGKMIKCWIANRDEMSPYPVDVVHDGEQFYAMMKKISTDKKDLETAATIKAKTGMYIMIGLAIVAVLYVIFGTHILDGLTASLTGVAKNIPGVPK